MHIKKHTYEMASKSVKSLLKKTIYFNNCN